MIEFITVGENSLNLWNINFYDKQFKNHIINKCNSIDIQSRILSALVINIEDG